MIGFLCTHYPVHNGVVLCNHPFHGNRFSEQPTCTICLYRLGHIAEYRKATWKPSRTWNGGHFHLVDRDGNAVCDPKIVRPARTQCPAAVSCPACREMITDLDYLVAILYDGPAYQRKRPNATHAAYHLWSNDELATGFSQKPARDHVRIGS